MHGLEPLCTLIPALKSVPNPNKKLVVANNNTQSSNQGREMMEARKLVEVDLTELTCYVKKEPDLYLFGWMIVIIKGEE